MRKFSRRTITAHNAGVTAYSVWPLMKSMSSSVKRKNTTSTIMMSMTLKYAVAIFFLKLVTDPEDMNDSLVYSTPRLTSRLWYPLWRNAGERVLTAFITRSFYLFTSGRTIMETSAAPTMAV